MKNENKKSEYLCGNQQFADLIINSKESNLNETDSKFIKLIYENTESEEERKKLIKNLEIVKSPEKSDEEKSKSNKFLGKFLESSVGEAGKQIVKELIENGADYLQGLNF